MLYHYSKGEEGLSPILFLHGFLGAATDWDPVLASLQQHFRCIAVDLPGHGRSVRLAAHDYTLDGASNALVRMLDHLKIERCGLAGYSMGGRLALYLALHHPERCSRLVLESASPGLQSEVERQARRGVDEAHAVRLEARDLEGFLEDWYAKPLFASLYDRPLVREEVLRARRRNDPPELARSLRSMGAGVQSPLWDRLGDLTAPTLFIAGALDGKYVEVAERFGLLGDHVRTAVFPDAGHNVHLEYPAEYADLLREFFGAPG